MNIYQLRFFLLLILCAICNGIGSPPEMEKITEMVKLKSHENRFSKTSSTLRWKPSKAGKPLPNDAITVNAHNSQYVWCRGTFSSKKVPGGVVENGTCAFAFYGPSVLYAETYQVLISYEGSARVKLVAWDSYMTKPINSLLSSDRALIAVSDEHNSSDYLAGNVGLKYNERNVLYPNADSVAKTNSGFILVEDEPVTYNLRNISFKEKSEKVYISKKTLNSTQLSNAERSKKLVSHTFSYALPRVQYWGKVKGCVTALPSMIYPDEGGPMEVLWGMETTSKRIEFSLIKYDLPPLCAVNVTVVGTVEDYRAPYEGILTAIYDDGFTRDRHISSRHIGKVFNRVVVVFSKPFYLNGSIVDEASERSELLYEYTTTTSTTQAPTTTVSPLLKANILSSTPSISQTPKYIGSSKYYEKITSNVTPTSEIPTPLNQKELRNSKSIIYEEEIGTVEKEHKSTSDRIVGVLSTIFTGLVFWYFSLGITA